jgi:hypothetical protein
MKQLVILALIVYIVSKLSGFFFRITASSHRNDPSQSRRPVGNVKVDSTPKKEKRSTIKGGDYVDYEEVK